MRKLEIAKGKKLALKVALRVMNDEDVRDVDYVEVYKSLISSRLVALNKKAIKQKKSIFSNYHLHHRIVFPTTQ